MIRTAIKTANAASTRFDDGAPAALSAPLKKDFFVTLCFTNECVSRQVVRKWQVITYPATLNLPYHL